MNTVVPMHKEIVHRLTYYLRIQPWNKNYNVNTDVNALVCKIRGGGGVTKTIWPVYVDASETWSKYIKLIYLINMYKLILHYTKTG